MRITVMLDRSAIPVETGRQRDGDDRTARSGQSVAVGPLSDFGSNGAGSVPPEVAPDLWRSLVEVVGTSTVGSERMIEVVIPSWVLDQTVRLPESILPEEIRLQLTPGVRLLLLADVNIGESDPDKLVFRNFRLAPRPTWDL
jgi:hypothetical protein